MGETVIDGYHCEKSEPIPVSKTSRLHVLERCTEPCCANDKVEGKCGHFSIRGYVADIRCRDWKMSWPFFTHDECNQLDEHAHCLPPMNVSEFKWWRCPNCLSKAGATGPDTDGGIVHCFCIVKDDAQNLDEVQQVLKENSSERGKGGEGASAILNDSECYPSLWSDRRQKEALVFFPSEDGKSDHIAESCEPVSHSPLKEVKALHSSLSMKTNKHVHNLSLPKKTILHDNNSLDAVSFEFEGNGSHHKQCSTRDEGQNAGSNFKFCASMSKNASEFHCMDAVGSSVRHLVNMNETRDKVTSNYGMFREVDRSVKNDVPLNAIRGPTGELDSMGLYESDNDISENEVDLDVGDVHDQRIAGHLGTSSGTTHQKKGRKMRLLTDIIKSEVSGASEKTLIFNKDAEIKGVHAAANHSKGECDVSKDLDLHSDLKSSLVVHNDDKKNIVHKKCSTTLQVEDKGSSLLRWLKDVAGKAKIPKRYGESKCKEHIAPEAVNSKSSPEVSARTLPPRQTDVATQSSKKVNVSKKKNKMTCFEDEQLLLTRCREPVSEKSKANAGNAETEYIVTKTVQSNSQNALPVLSSRQGPNHRKATLSEKNKMPQVENGTSMHWQKDALALSNYNPVTELRGNKKPSKKHEQETSKTCEHDSSDDIPMEIVELMAKNQHERLMLNAEDTAGNMYKVPETNANMAVPSILDLTQVCGNEGPGSLHEKDSSVHILRSSNARSGECTAGKKVRKSGKKLNGNTRDCRRDNNRLLSMKQQKQSYASRGIVPFSQFQENPSSGLQFPATFSGRNPDRQSLTGTQFLDGYHQNQTVRPWGTCGQAYDGLPVLSNRTPLNINNLHKVDHLGHQDVVFHCPHPSPKRNESTNNHGTCGPKSRRPDLAHSLQKRRGEFLSETNKQSIQASSYSSLEQGNGCLSTMPPNLYSNDTISAMNLLRLMDQGASSSTPVDVSMFGKQANPQKKPQFSHNHKHKEFFGLENGVVKTGSLPMCPRPFELLGQHHRLGSACEFSPCKIGELRCSLHEAPSNSNKSRHHGFINGPSNNAASPKSHGKGKSKSSHSSIQITGTKPVAQAENVGNAKKRLLSTSNSLAQPNNSCTTEICTINRNPAEFTIPGAENTYMIGSEDLKFMDMLTSSGKMRPAANVEGHKRRRMMKLTAIQGS